MTYNKNKLSDTLASWSRDLINFRFPEKGVGLIFAPNFVYKFFEEKCFSNYNLLTDQISLSDCLYLSRYWAIYVLHLFVNQAVTS